MSLLRNEGDNSINFQKASFTLDGCVKIWTSRVDSVGTETGKLLSNLADEVKGLRMDGREGGEAGEDDEGKTKKARVSLIIDITSSCSPAHCDAVDSPRRSHSGQKSGTTSSQTIRS